MDDALTDDLVEEVLLRLPPADPACLARAAVVCRRWRRLISDQAFRRRFCESHRNPPTLGFLRRVFRDGAHVTDFFLPASSFRPPHADVHVPTDWMAVDARHGRVLFRDLSASRSWPPGSIRHEFVVSSPMTGDVWMVPELLLPLRWYAGFRKDAVLCAAAVGGCDHLDCHRGPFAVVTILTQPSNDHTFAFIYSSETGTWRDVNSIDHTIGQVVPWRPAFAGNTIYFLFFLESSNTCRILEYDLGKEELSLIDAPCEASPDFLILVENGGRLGIAVVEHSNKVCVWSMETSSHHHHHQNNNNGRRAWVLNRVIE